MDPLYPRLYIFNVRGFSLRGRPLDIQGRGRARKNFEINNFGLENSEKNNLLLRLREKIISVFKIVKKKVIARILGPEPPLRPKFPLEQQKHRQLLGAAGPQTSAYILCKSRVGTF